LLPMVSVPGERISDQFQFIASRGEECGTKDSIQRDRFNASPNSSLFWPASGAYQKRSTPVAQLADNAASGSCQVREALAAQFVSSVRTGPAAASKAGARRSDTRAEALKLPNVRWCRSPSS